MAKDDINIGEFKRKFLTENNEDPAKDHFAKAEDNLYKKVTGEEPKASTKNKFRDVKEGDESLADQIRDLIIDAAFDAEVGVEGHISSHKLADIVVPQILKLIGK